MIAEQTASAVAFANIALIKYWGNRDDALRLPANGSISMNLDGLLTRTRVEWGGSRRKDSLTINGRSISGNGLQRVSLFLDIIRKMVGFSLAAQVTSKNNFPSGAGIASSAAAFAALALAGSKAAGLELSEAELSRLARRGSGSACRSIPSGFVEWRMDEGDAGSFASSLAPPEHWELADCIAILSTEHKTVGSTTGHALAGTSPLQAGRITGAPHRLDLCRRAILERDFEALAAVVELDSNLMHSVMVTSTPPLFYWQPSTLAVMTQVRDWRSGGLPVCYSVDAGPNVHVLTEAIQGGKIASMLAAMPGVQEVRVAHVGGPAKLVE